MKNKNIIDSFNKINCEDKDILFDRIVRRKKINFKFIPVFAALILVVLVVQNLPQQDDNITPLNTKTTDFNKTECIENEENLEICE